MDIIIIIEERGKWMASRITSGIKVIMIVVAIL